MRFTSEPLSHELDRLKGIFSPLSLRFLAASEDFRKSAVPLPEDLVFELSDFKRSIADLGSRILDFGKELSLTIDLRVGSLEDLERSLHILRGVEEQHANAAAKEHALAVLERVLRIVRRDGAVFPPLTACQSKALELRDSIMIASASELHPATREIFEGTHALPQLLDLVEHQNDFTDEECLRFQEVIAESLGKDLAIAAIRGKLEVAPLSTAPPSLTPEEFLESSDQELSQELLSPTAPESFETVSQISDASSHPVTPPNSGVDQEIEEFLAGFASKTQWSRTPVGNSMLAVKNEVEVPKTQLTEATSPAVQFSAPAVQAIDMEILKLEEDADLRRAEGKYSEAQVLYQQVLEVQEKLLPPEDPNIARTLNNLAAIHHFLEEPTPAKATSVEPVIIPQEKFEGELFGVGKQTAEPQPGKYRILQTVMLSMAVLGAGALLYRPIRSRFMNSETPTAQSTSSPVAPAPTSFSQTSTPPQDMTPPQPAQQPENAGQQDATSNKIVSPKTSTSPLEAIPPTPTLPRPVEQRQESLRPNANPQREPVSESSVRQAQAKPQEVQEPIEASAPIPPPRQITTRREEPVPLNLSNGVSVSSSAVALKNLIGAPSQVPPPPSPTPIRIGGEQAAAKLISRSTVTYPPLARQSRIQGTVRLEAVISRDGSVKQLAVLSGPQLLRGAALDAVKQWRYQPALQNGIPVEVITTVEVNFTLQ